MQAAVKVFHAPQVNLGARLDVDVGPYGRSCAVDAAMSTTGLNANYRYSMSKGLYADISLQGSVIATRKSMNRKFYGRAGPHTKRLAERLDRAIRGRQAAVRRAGCVDQRASRSMLPWIRKSWT